MLWIVSVLFIEYVTESDAQQKKIKKRIIGLLKNIFDILFLGKMIKKYKKLRKFKMSSATYWAAILSTAPKFPKNPMDR